MKRIISLFLTLFISLTIFAQDDNEKKGSADFGADLMSRYVWRGLDAGGAPSIQPWVEYEYDGLTIGAWGAYTTDNSGATQEFDLYVGYTFADVVSITATDYFFPMDGELNNYFEYADEETDHILEISISYDGTDDLPLTLLAARNSWGSDNESSLYFEAGYAFGNFETFVGFGNGMYSQYGGANIEGVNVGFKTSKEVKITDHYNLPMNLSFVVNPNTENAFLVFGLQF